MANLRRFATRFLRRSARLGDAPLNKASLLVIVLVDLFILTNLFIGLDAIGQWPLGARQAYPCQQEWQAYRDPAAVPPLRQRQLTIIGASLADPGFRQRALAAETDHLGRVDPTCLRFAALQDQIATQPEPRRLGGAIAATAREIGSREDASAAIRRQYDSTLLEQISGQSRTRSIHPVAADEARRQLEANERRVAELQARRQALEDQLRADPASRALLAFLAEEGPYQVVQRGHARALFWEPSLRMLFQALFLAPLVLLALAVHRWSSRRGHGLIALISWHLLVISLIPLLLKLFEFAQLGVLFSFIAERLSALFGNLLFLVSYVYVLAIPLVGFGLIKLLQGVLFNTRIQAGTRVQKGRCLQCARRLQAGSRHCPHCGYDQLQICGHCHRPTHRHLPFCRHCGSPQPELAAGATLRQPGG